ncbi:hypothetical protein QA600_22685 [Natronococcus sp. A-GB1]|uniref:hypothetical protein n=1 Tax=Natronococcus sp. A-GB1 TaxID=3037648 RepID=UPI00241F1B68|nr:hypothetical protein [Natronococcus sp. A-GB1]MDG5762124.1 hypothetical protein [Natronococcus sp. A-GB1]
MKQQSIKEQMGKVLSISIALCVLNILLAIAHYLFIVLISIVSGVQLTTAVFSPRNEWIVGFFILVAGASLISGSISYMVRQYLSQGDRDLSLEYAYAIIAFSCGAAVIRVSLQLL